MELPSFPALSLLTSDCWGADPPAVLLWSGFRGPVGVVLTLLPWAQPSTGPLPATSDGRWNF